MREQANINVIIRSIWAPILRLCGAIPTGEPDQAKYDALRTEVPFLYGLLIANACGLALTHIRYAPTWLVVYVPLVLGAACTIRMICCFQARGQLRPGASPGNRVRVRPGLGATLAIGYACWGIALYPYGDALAKCHAAFVVFGAVVGCTLCLVYMRAALLVVTLVSVVPFLPFILYSLLRGEYESTTIMIDLALVAGAMAFVLRGHHGRLADLLQSQYRLAKKLQEAAQIIEENFRLANVDSLTLLPKRQRFFSDLDALLVSRSATQSGFAVGVLEIDGLKSLERLFGHEFRDRVLKDIGRRLLLFANPDVIIARTGDRTLGLLVRNNVTVPQLQDMGALARTHLEQPYELSGKVAHLSVSVGFALYPQAGTTARHLYQRARFALQHAKTVRQGHTVVIAENHESAIRRDSAIEHHLLGADLDQELSVVFQPIFDVSSRGIIAFEALARWNSPALGVVSPTDFLVVAERTHLIHALTGVLLRKTLEAAAVWSPQLHVSFNLSARDFGSAETIDAIISTVVASGMAPDRINFEVTETALINNINRARQAMLALKHMGAQIYLDDFGTGYSNLSYLRHLPIDVVKIDRSFITDIAEQQTARIVVQTMVDLCHRLSLKCIAEGVETASQVNALLDVGCNVMQGYFFGRPVASSDVAGYFLSNGFLDERSEFPS